eukprot:2427263-Rhodomonas_salina.1
MERGEGRQRRLEEDRARRAEEDSAMVERDLVAVGILVEEPRGSICGSFFHSKRERERERP